MTLYHSEPLSCLIFGFIFSVPFLSTGCPFVALSTQRKTTELHYKHVFYCLKPVILEEQLVTIMQQGLPIIVTDDA